MNYLKYRTSSFIVLSLLIFLEELRKKRIKKKRQSKHVTQTNTTMEVENRTIALSFTPEVSQVPQDTDREFLGMICLKAPTYSSEKRAAINTVAVIDRSGSMSGWTELSLKLIALGTPLTLVKDSLHFVINNLTPEDRLGIVTFDDSVAEVLPLTSMDEVGKVGPAKPWH